MQFKKEEKILSVVLATVMIFSLLPLGSIAYAQGHTHDDACYAEGGEMTCGQEEIASNSNAAVAYDNSDYGYIQKLLIDDNSISYDPNTQTFLVIDVDAVQSENMKKYDIYHAEEHIQEYNLTFDVSINDTKIRNGDTYYLVSQTDDTIETATVSDSFKMAANSGKVAVFILNKDDSYQVSHSIEDCYYTNQYWQDESGNTYNGDQFTCRPTNEEVLTEYRGTADDTPIIAPFSFQWDMSNYFDVEIWMTDIQSKLLSYPGFIFSEGATGHVNFKIELRDADGNITLLPKTFFNNYGNANIFSFMREDGIISIPLEYWTLDATTDATYGEFDVYIPFGYDYRITLLSYSVDTLGGYAYYYDQEHE